ncbi:MAG: T9SS type A sorting domain-containing protein [Flavobacteriales bacterium]|jgi:hypothetical protein|nr:T9SS type A sorting domain-containing protein [Flavobacteriales bacterium]
MNKIIPFLFLLVSFDYYAQCNGPIDLDVVVDYADCSDPNSGVITLLTQDIDSVTFSIDGVNFVNTPQFSNLGPGVYNFTINDTTGCSRTATETIPNPLAVDFVTTTTSCNSINTGSIQAGGADGFPIYQYSFNGGLTYDTSSLHDQIGPGTYHVYIKDNYDCEVDTMITVDAFPTISPTITPTNEQCNGSGPGSVDITFTDGATYDFSLNNGPSSSGTTYNNASLNAGYYVIDITDQNGCTSPFQFQVGADLVDDSVNINHEYCHYGNGDIEVFGFLGVAPYEYSIDNGTTYLPSGAFNNLSAGQHVVLIKDATGCVKTDSIYVTNFGGIVTTPSADDTVCLGSSSIVSVSHNAGVNASYQWNNGLSNIQSHTVTPTTTTTYSVIVTDSYGCEDTSATTIYVEITPSVSLSQSQLQACIGDSIQLTAYGATNYIWSTGDTTDVMNYVAIGNETITVTGYNGQCSNNEQMVIVIKPSPTAVASSNSSSINTGDSIFFSSAGSVTSTTTWDFGDGFSSQESAPYHHFNFPGAYYVILTAEMGGCEDQDTILVYVGTVSITEQDQNQILLYPNPAKDYVNIQLDSNAGFKLIDLYGKLVKQQILTQGTNQVSIQDLPRGVYVGIIETEETYKELKLIIQ